MNKYVRSFFLPTTYRQTNIQFHKNAAANTHLQPPTTSSNDALLQCPQLRMVYQMHIFYRYVNDFAPDYAPYSVENHWNHKNKEFYNFTPPQPMSFHLKSFDMLM